MWTHALLYSPSCYAAGVVGNGKALLCEHSDNVNQVTFLVLLSVIVSCVTEWNRVYCINHLIRYHTIGNFLFNLMGKRSFLFCQH